MSTLLRGKWLVIPQLNPCKGGFPYFKVFLENNTKNCLANTAVYKQQFMH